MNAMKPEYSKHALIAGTVHFVYTGTPRQSPGVTARQQRGSYK